jgi:hypothetical protein
MSLAGLRAAQSLSNIAVRRGRDESYAAIADEFVRLWVEVIVKSGAADRRLAAGP